MLKSFLFLIILSCNFSKPDLPKLYKLPSFDLTDQYGKGYGSRDLNDHVYFFSFVFTSCTMSCPITLRVLSNIQKKIKDFPQNVKMITLSVDPETDTPPILLSKAIKYKADPKRWKFLTGEEKKVKNFITKGLKSAMQKVINDLGDEIDIAHSDRFILVDKKGIVRGLYDQNNPEQIKNLLRDIKLLL